MLSNRSLLIAQVYRPPNLELKFAQNWLDHIIDIEHCSLSMII